MWSSDLVGRSEKERRKHETRNTEKKEDAHVPFAPLAWHTHTHTHTGARRGPFKIYTQRENNTERLETRNMKCTLGEDGPRRLETRSWPQGQLAVVNPRILAHATPRGLSRRRDEPIYGAVLEHWASTGQRCTTIVRWRATHRHRNWQSVEFRVRGAL